MQWLGKQLLSLQRILKKKYSHENSFYNRGKLVVVAVKEETPQGKKKGKGKKIKPEPQEGS
jgi:hypothetical protein